MSSLTQHIAVYIATSHRSCAISTYELAVQLVRNYSTPKSSTHALNLRKDFPSIREVNFVRSQLEKYGVLARSESGGANYSLVVARPPEDDAELACALDPTCYASHQSALVYHGLTDQFPLATTMSVQSKSDWSVYVEERMKRDLGAHLDRYQAEFLPQMQRVRVKSKKSRSNVVYFQPKLTPSYVLLRDGRLRVSSIGRTFLEMLRQPDLCGGMPHVVSCFRASASRYVDLIFSEIDRFGAPIDKVRAGYLLERVANISDARLEAWLAFVARGGSRKVDPASPYAPEYSERWSLSLNLPGLPR